MLSIIIRDPKIRGSPIAKRPAAKEDRASPPKKRKSSATASSAADQPTGSSKDPRQASQSRPSTPPTALHVNTELANDPVICARKGFQMAANAASVTLTHAFTVELAKVTHFMKIEKDAHDDAERRLEEAERHCALVSKEKDALIQRNNSLVTELDDLRKKFDEIKKERHALFKEKIELETRLSQRSVAADLSMSGSDSDDDEREDHTMARKISDIMKDLN